MNLSQKEIRTALDNMTEEAFADWIDTIRKAGANLDNAAYGLAGKVPDAKPDPMTWSISWLSVALDQIDTAVKQLAPNTGISANAGNCADTNIN